MKRYFLLLGALLMIAPAISEARVYCKSTNTGRFCAGLSSDTKPTVAETNDEFFETDTKDLYKYAGAAWSLYVNGSAAGGVGGNASEYVDDDDFTDGTTVGQLLQGVAEATGSSVTDGDIGALGMTVKRALKVTIVDNNDDSAVDAAANAVKVTMATTLSGEDQTNSVFKVEQQWEREDVAASQTDQALGATGGVGDLLAGYYCVATGTTGGVVEIEDGASAAFTLIPSGATAGIYQSDYLGWITTNGAWEVTTPTNITCRFTGRFL